MEALNEVSKERSEMNVAAVFFAGGLKTLVAKKDLWRLIDDLSKTKHVDFLACNNTMGAFGIKLTDLPPEFKTVGSGAFKVMKLESEGYTYFRP